ncbi:MAG TPA: MBL fold metallo-hydrolase [Deferrisomatales bacterium]|nr:MBL fold metallo-hydrolase [Deferrisomatales bacterium]
MLTARGSITVLTDNTVPERSETLAEHGFAALVQTQAGNLLFDTGRGRTVVHNAAVLKKDLARIDKIVLSHAHGDHTGGPPEVLQVLQGKNTDVLAHPEVFAERVRDAQGKRVFGGIPYQRGYLEKMGARFVFNREVVEVDDRVFLTGEVPRDTPFEAATGANAASCGTGTSNPTGSWTISPSSSPKGHPVAARLCPLRDHQRHPSRASCDRNG